MVKHVGDICHGIRSVAFMSSWPDRDQLAVPSMWRDQPRQGLRYHLSCTHPPSTSMGRYCFVVGRVPNGLLFSFRPLSSLASWQQLVHVSHQDGLSVLRWRRYDDTRHDASFAFFHSCPGGGIDSNVHLIRDHFESIVLLPGESPGKQECLLSGALGRFGDSWIPLHAEGADISGR